MRAGDSDMAAPIVSRDGHVMGMIALRGVPFAALRTVSLSDLNIVARWLSRALSTGNTETIAAGPAAPAERLGHVG